MIIFIETSLTKLQLFAYPSFGSVAVPDCFAVIALAPVTCAIGELSRFRLYRLVSLAHASPKVMTAMLAESSAPLFFVYVAKPPTISWMLLVETTIRLFRLIIMGHMSKAIVTFCTQHGYHLGLGLKNCAMAALDIGKVHALC